MIKSKIQTWISQNRLSILYILYTLIQLLIHSMIQTGSNDDAWFAAILDTHTPWNYLAGRYRQWTSRLPMELLTIYLTRWNPRIWKLLNVGITVLLVRLCALLAGKQNCPKHTCLLMFLTLLFPRDMLSSAGWITTTVNYLWPLTLGLAGLLPLRWSNEQYCTVKSPAPTKDRLKLPSLSFALCYLAFCFACFQEQAAAILMTVYILYGGYELLQKEKLRPFWYLFTTTAAAILLFIITCPGNTNRACLETQTWFPEFAGFTCFQKLLTGFITAMSYYVTCDQANLLFLLFTAVLIPPVFCRCNRPIVRAVAALPFSITFFWGFTVRVITKLHLFSPGPLLTLLQNDRLPEYGGLPLQFLTAECLVFLFLLAAAAGSLYWIFGRGISFLTAFTILGAVICSRIILGFSPTVYVSGARTALAGCIGLILLISMCVKKIRQEGI